MGDSPGRLLSSLSGREGQLPPHMDGCAGVLLHLFQWNSRLPGRKYFSPKLFFSGCLNSSKKKKHYSEKLPMAKLLLIADENCLGESFNSTISDANLSTEGAGSKRTPGVVARLMGLESLPTMEQDKDGSYVQLHSDNDDDTHKFARPSAIQDSSSSRDLKENPCSTAESSNVLTPTESNHQKLLISKPKRTEIVNKQSIDDVANIPQQQFHVKELCFPSVSATGGDLISGKEIPEQRRREQKCSADIDTLLEVFDSKTSISKTSLSELKQDNQSSEERQCFKANSTSLPPAVQICNADSVKTASTKWFSSTKQELLERRLNQNFCEQSDRFHSIGAASSRDMEVKTKAALPCRIKRNSNSPIQNRMHSPATPSKDLLRDTLSIEILQKAPLLIHCGNDSHEQANSTNTSAPRTPNSAYEKNSSIKSKQQSDLSTTSQIVERTEASHEKDSILGQNDAKFHKKDRLFRNTDVTLRTSKKSSEHMIRSGRCPQNNTSEHPKVRHDPSKRIVNKGMMSEGNISKHYAPLIDGNKGNIPKNDLMHTESTESNHLSGCQSPSFSRKAKSMEYQPSREISACHSRPDSCSTSLEVQTPHASDHAGGSETFHKFSSDTKRHEASPHECIYLSVDAGCDCIHDKHTVDDVVSGPVIRESKIKEIAQISSTSLLKNVLKVNSKRISEASIEIMNIPDKQTESSANILRSKQTLQHILDSQAEDLAAVNTPTTPESRIPSQIVCNSSFHAAKRRIGAGTFRPDQAGGADIHNITAASAGNSSCDRHSACWWENASESSIPWNNFKVTTMDDDFESPPIKFRHQRMSVEQADVCESMSDSTYTEDSEHPSPVSVIDSHSPKKFHPRQQKEYQQHMYEYHMKVLQFSSELPASEFRVEKFSKVFQANSRNNEQIRGLGLTASPTGLAENERTNDNWNLKHHSKRAPIASEFELVNQKWALPYSHSFRIDPILFEKIEKYQCFHRAIEFLECKLPEDAVISLRLHRRSKSFRTHHQLLFDCVDEALDSSLCQSMLSCRHLNNKHSNPDPPGEHIVDLMRNCVSGWQKLSLEAVESVADIELRITDADSTNLRQEIAELTRITEDMVFDDLIEELSEDFIPLQR